MKVLHLNFTENYGGAATAANRLHKELLNLGINSKMLVLRKQTKDPTVIEVSSLYSHLDRAILLFRKIYNRIRISFSPQTNNFSNKSLLLSVLRKLDFDILHLHWVTDGFVNFSEFKNSNGKIVWTMHDCAAFTGICHVIGNCNNFRVSCGECPQINSAKKNDKSNMEFLRKLEFYSKKRIYYVAPSKWLASIAFGSSLLRNSEILVIPHGIDIEKFSPIPKAIAKEALQIRTDSKMILCGAVTLDDENKGMQIFKKALLVFKENNFSSEKIELMFFGENKGEEVLNDFKTTYSGYLSDELLLRICYSAADVVVVPSKQESFGLISLEAMACGTPVVAFAATGQLDIIDHKINGYLAKPYEPDDLAIGIKWCLDNNKDLIISEQAREKVISAFNIKMIAQKYTELYSKILSGK